MADHGVTELNVVAQDTTRYGVDLYGKPMLPELLRRLAQIESLRWIRVLYTYPDWITDELLDVMAREEKIVKYLDIPLQHCKQKSAARNEPARRPGIAYRADEKNPGKGAGHCTAYHLDHGFSPVKRRSSLRKLCQFVQEIRFERLGCFPYSAEEGTPAGERDRSGRSRGAAAPGGHHYGTADGDYGKNITRGWSDPI